MLKGWRFTTLFVALDPSAAPVNWPATKQLWQFSRMYMSRSAALQGRSRILVSSPQCKSVSWLAVTFQTHENLPKQLSEGENEAKPYSANSRTAGSTRRYQKVTSCRPVSGSISPWASLHCPQILQHQSSTGWTRASRGNRGPPRNSPES